MSAAEIEKRLAAVEREIARLKSDRGQIPRRHPVQTLEAIHASFEDDESFRQAMRLGRKWRESQRPKTRKTKARRK